ncbi:MAG: hypothetical protein ACF8XB_08820, partial [Planctomycetota bacterium JB042]
FERRHQACEPVKVRIGEIQREGVERPIPPHVFPDDHPRSPGPFEVPEPLRIWCQGRTATRPDAGGPT